MAQTKYFANEERYWGRGEVVGRETGTGKLIVEIEGVGRSSISPEYVFDRKKDAKAIVQPMIRGGWADAAQLGMMVR